MLRRSPGARGAVLFILAWASCFAAPAAGLRIHEQQPEEDGDELVFLPSGQLEDEPPAETPLLQRESGRSRRIPDYKKEAPRSNVPKKALRRVIFAPRFNAGFDSSFSQMYGFMQLGMIANAGVVFRAPKDMLSPDHGSTYKVAESWDKYLQGAPQFYSEQEVVECARERWELERFVDEFRLGNASVFFDHSKPLCVDLIVNWYRIRQERIVREVLDSSGKEPQLFASKALRKRFNRAYGELMAWSGGNYSVVHVRQGDMGRPHCTSPAWVTKQMYEFGPHDHWLLASNADEAWYTQMKQQAASMKLTFITERGGWVGALEDNYFRYCLLKCAFGSAERFLGTYKHAVFECTPAKRRQTEQKVRLLCDGGANGAA